MTIAISPALEPAEIYYDHLAYDDESINADRYIVAASNIGIYPEEVWPCEMHLRWRGPHHNILERLHHRHSTSYDGMPCACYSNEECSIILIVMQF